MGGLAAQKAAKIDDGVYVAQIRNCPRRCRNLPCAGNADDFNFSPLCAAAQQSVQRAFEQPFGDHRIPARNHNGKLHARGGEVALDGQRLGPQRICPGPEAARKPRLRLDGKDARPPVSFSDGGEAGNGCIAAFGAQPALGSLIDGIERGHFHQQIGCRREFAVDNLKVAQRRQERCAVTVLFIPSPARFKPQRRKESRQPVISRCAAGGTKNRDPLDHGLILSCGSGGAARRRVSESAGRRVSESASQRVSRSASQRAPNRAPQNRKAGAEPAFLLHS